MFQVLPVGACMGSHTRQGSTVLLGVSFRDECSRFDRVPG